MENVRVEQLRLQQLGEDWIQAIAAGMPDRLARICHPEIKSGLLLPTRFVTLDTVIDLVAKFRQWFGECTDIQLQASRVAAIGERLGIFYRFLIQEQEDWYTIEQQLYCTLKDGQIEQLHLLCSGFQPVGGKDQTVSVETSEDHHQDPVRDGLLEFHTEASEIGSTCAVLTPAIRSKLREMQSGQVLEVRVDDPSAKGDVEAWSRLSGNKLLKVIDTEGRLLRFFVKKK